MTRQRFLQESNLAVLKASGEKQENAKDGASADAVEMRLLLERQVREVQAPRRA